MSPLGQGPRGYSDWQRIENWDGPALLNLLRTSKEHMTSPITECSRYGYIAGRINGSGLVNLVVTVQWFLDAEGAIPVGLRQFMISPRIPEPMLMRIPSMGPFCQIDVGPQIAGVEWAGQARVFLTNRVSTTELIPSYPQLAFVAQAFGGAGEVEVWPNTYYSGPAQCSVFAPGAAVGFVKVEALQPNGTFQEVDRVVANAGTLVVARVVIPTTAVRFFLTSAGAQTVTLAVTPFPTGSS